jgi:hypothetical protein
MTTPLLIGTVGVIAVTAIYFLWARKLPQAQQEQPKQQ